MCFAVPEKEVKAVAEVLQSLFDGALNVGRLSQVPNLILIQPRASFNLTAFNFLCSVITIQVSRLRRIMIFVDIKVINLKIDIV